MTTYPLVTAGKAGWVGSGNPDKTHFGAPRLKVDSGAALAFVHQRSPVPPGDTVTTGNLALTVAVGATGSFTFTARRVASRVDWSDLTWDNKPGVTGTTVTAAISNPAAGDVVTFDVMDHLQSIADGDPNYGWRIESDLTDPVKFYGFDSEHGPTLEVEASSIPSAPTDLIPAGVVSLADPYLQFTAPDTTGEDELVALQVQADTAPTYDGDGAMVTPDFDSGTVSTTVPDLDLSTTAFAGLADGGSTQWHARWQNSSGVWSPWSDTVTITRQTKSALTIDNPPAGATVLEPTPPFLATFAGVATAWRVIVANGTDLRDVHVRSGKKAATDPNDIAWTPNEADRLQDGEYTVIVDVWDDEDRVASAGDPVYTRATRTFTVDDEVGVTAPAAVSVTQDASLPVAVVEFTRASAPDSFVIQRNGETAAAEIDPSDVFVSGTTYRWHDTRLRKPMIEQDYKVRAVVNGEQSAWSNEVSGSVTPSGVWLISQDRTLSVVLANPNIDMSVTDEFGLFKVSGKSQLVMIRQSLGSPGSTYTGDLYPFGSRTVPDMLDDLEDLRQLNEPVFLIAADYAALVRIYNVVPNVHPNTKEGRVWRRVTFSFHESDR